MAWLIIPGKWQFDLYPGLTIKSWRLYYFACGLPSLLSVVLLFFLPESPKFLLAKGKNAEALSVLQRLYVGNHKIGDRFAVKRVVLNERERVGKLDVDESKAVAVFRLLWNQTVPLLKKPHGFNLMLLCTALFVCFFCDNGMYVWLPEALNRIQSYKRSTGKDEGSFCDVLSSGNYYNGSFNGSGMSSDGVAKKSLNVEAPVCDDEVDTSVYLVYILLGAATIIICIVITISIKYIKKKHVLLLLAAVNVMVTITIGWPDAVTLIAVKGSAMMMLQGATFPILFGVAVDLFPTNVRAMAGCLTLMASRLGTVAAHEANGFLIRSDCKSLLWSYIFCSAVCLLSIALLPSSPPDLLSTTKATSTATEEPDRRSQKV